MNAYQGLAGAYDSLTGDVAYEKRADYMEKLFARSRIPVHTVLDRSCLRHRHHDLAAHRPGL